MHEDKGKKPYLPLYINDFRADTLGLSATTTGIWIRFLCDMAWQQDYKVSGREIELCRIGGCTPAEIAQFCAENETRNFACVTTCHNIITVVSRRRLREHEKRENAKNRKQKQRSLDDVLDVSQPLPSRAGAEIENEYEYMFMNFWNTYGNKVDRKRSYKCWLKALDHASAEDIISAARAYTSWCREIDRTLKDPSTFLSDRDRPYLEWIEKAKEEQAEAQRTREAAQRREKEMASRQPAPAHESRPNPEGAKKIKAIAAGLGESMTAREETT